MNELSQQRVLDDDFSTEVYGKSWAVVSDSKQILELSPTERIAQNRADRIGGRVVRVDVQVSWEKRLR